MRIAIYFLTFAAIPLLVSAQKSDPTPNVGDLPPLPEPPVSKSTQIQPAVPPSFNDSELSIEGAESEVDSKDLSPYKVISSSEPYRLQSGEKLVSPKLTLPSNSLNSSTIDTKPEPSADTWTPPAISHSWSDTKGELCYPPISSKNPIEPEGFIESKNPIEPETITQAPVVKFLTTETIQKNKRKFNLKSLFSYSEKQSSFQIRGRLGAMNTIRYPNVKGSSQTRADGNDFSDQ